MMLLTYVPEGDLVRVMYVSGRREYVPIEVAWRDLDARPRLQNGLRGIGGAAGGGAGAGRTVAGLVLSRGGGGGGGGRRLVVV